MSTSALGGLKVLDLTENVSGPYCTKLMAGFGAEVLKVERPRGGDALRGEGPFYGGKEGVERSIPFLWLNTGKKSVTIDIETEEGVEIIEQLAARVDVLVENFAPGTMSDRGLSYEKLKEINPRLVMTSVSPFGQTGPYRDFEAEHIQLYAMSGLMNETGDPEKAPLNSGPAVAHYSAALSAYMGTLIALFHRGASGAGQHVDVSTQEASMVNIEMSMVNCLQQGKVRKRSGDHHVMVPWELFECADGQASIVGGPIRHWKRAAKVLDEPKLFEERFYHCKDRMARRAEFEELLIPCVKKLKKKDLFRAGQEQGLGFSYLANLDEVLDSPQHKARGVFVEIDHPEVGKHRHVGAPFRMSRSPWKSERAPLLGEHTDEVLSDLLGYAEERIEALKARGVI